MYRGRDSKNVVICLNIHLAENLKGNFLIFHPSDLL